MKNYKTIIISLLAAIILGGSIYGPEVVTSVLFDPATNNPIGVQYPLQVDGDTVYCKDVWISESDTTNWTGGDACVLFEDLHTVLVNETTDNPKEILIHFNRTIPTTVFGIGAHTGDFSNVKVIGLLSGMLEFTIVDESSDNTKYSTNQYDIPAVGLNAIKIQFHTTDTVSISNLFITKAQARVSRITGQKPDGTFAEFQATTKGNFKVSIEEYEPDAILDQDFMLAVARGKIPGASTVEKFGQNEGLTTSYEDIWDVGGTYIYPADGVADITHIVSTDNADTEEIEVQGLSSDGTLTIQTKALTGQTPVQLDTALWRVFRLKNEGAIDLAGTVCASDNAGATAGVPDGVCYAQIVNGNNQTLMSLYTIPLGKTGYIYQGTSSMIGTVTTYSISSRLWMREYGKVFQLKKTFGLQSTGASSSSTQTCQRAAK